MRHSYPSRETSSFHSPQENGENSVLETLSRVHSFRWLRRSFEKQFRILVDAPWKVFWIQISRKHVVSFLMTVNLFAIIPWPLSTVVLFQRIWSFSFNRFVSLNQIHRMANQVINRIGQSTLTFQRCLIFTIYVFHISSLFIQYELRSSEISHTRLKSLLPKMQKRDLARVSIRRQTHYSLITYA